MGLIKELKKKDIPLTTYGLAKALGNDEITREEYNKVIPIARNKEEWEAMYSDFKSMISWITDGIGDCAKYLSRTCQNYFPKQ